MNLSVPLSEVPRIGPVYEKRLKKLGITTLRDLLFYFPRDYEDFSHISNIGEVHEGKEYCIEGNILQIQERRTFRKRLSITEALFQDTTGAIKVLWFNQPYLATTLRVGDAVVLAGRVVREKEGIYLSNPVYEKIRNAQLSIPNYELTHVGRIVPVYQETAGISSRWLRSIIKMVLAQLEEPQETLPEKMLKEKKFLLLKRALWQIHFPDSLALANAAKHRFAFEELFSILLFILSERKKLAAVKAPSIPLNAPLMKKFTDSLPFRLTDAQKKAAWHILKDLEKPRPMNRLLEGEVGSGKTVVGLMAALSAAKHGFQTAWMAPTEILAQQHFKTAGQLLAPFKITVALLTGKFDRFISPKLPNDFIEASRRKLLSMAKEGKVHVVIGTHALIQETVRFGNLGLVIIDEQHRFGVAQRAKLQDTRYKVEPLFYPVSMDANVALSFVQTLVNIYKQQRRWAYGVADIPYFLFGFLKNRKIPFSKKLSLGFELIEGHLSWATAPILLFFVGWLPLILGGPEFSQTLLAYNLPQLTSRILTLATAGLITSAIISINLLPTRKPEYGKRKVLVFALQWILFPLTMVFFAALPALDAQIRLMLGKYMGFWHTPKFRR